MRFRLTAKNNRFWVLLILLLYICCVYKDKIVENDSYWRTKRPYKFRELQYTIVKKINLSSNKSIRNYKLFIIYFRCIRIKLYFIIFFIRFLYIALKRRNSRPPDVSSLDALNDYTWQRHLAEKTSF